jgi:hypothetical protein
MKKKNGDGAATRPRGKPQDWFDEVVETIEVMCPIVLAGGSLLSIDSERPDQQRELAELAHIED